MKHPIAALLGLALSVVTLTAADVEPGFTALFDGKTLEGWKKANENQSAFSVEDGAIKAKGERCHLFYVGDEKPFKNFELRVDVKTLPKSNGGIYFHTKYQETGWPKGGFECQVNVTHGDWKKTGSLYDVANLGHTPAKDNQWWTQTIIVEGNKVTVKIDDVVVLQYTERPGAQAGGDFERKLGSGTFALQAHDPGSTVYFKNIRVKRLAD
ncbi:MAG TPA: DUF1080 domain-containing protein [Verrucomicrobiales bacterium]|nr:DUF1080 domain-containing protein [Verrucomicrobiales bacterium]